jgi:hypothetical protein
MSEQQLREFAGSVHVHGGSWEPVEYMGEPQDLREINKLDYGRNWEPLRPIRGRVDDLSEWTREADDVEFGHVYCPGERESNQD